MRRVVVTVLAALLMTGCLGSEDTFAGPDCIPRPATPTPADSVPDRDTTFGLPPLPPGQSYCPPPNINRIPLP